VIPSLRDARPADLPAINDLYNYYVLNSTATFHERPMPIEERRAWWDEHENRYPLLVAEDGDQLLGWAVLSPYSGRCGYRFTVEDSVYLRPEACGKGLGRELLTALLDRGAAAGFHSVVAIIAAESEPSIRLHAGLGFREVGRLHEVGFKFGRWLDVIFMQRRF
jgi:L-amino acid N-acyltransferase YncA